MVDFLYLFYHNSRLIAIHIVRLEKAANYLSKNISILCCRPKIASSCLFIVLMLILPTSIARAQQTLTFPGEQPVPATHPFSLDTSEIIRLIDTAEALQRSHPDSAINLLQHSLLKSREKAYPLGIAKSLLHMGKAYAFAGKYEKSLRSFQEAAIYSKDAAQGGQLLPEIFNGIGTVYQTWGNFGQAAMYYYQGAMIAGQLSDNNYIGSIYNNSAAMMLQLGLSEQFLYYLRKAERMARREDNQDLLGAILLNKGNIFLVQGQWGKAETYFHQALTLGRTYNLPHIRQSALSNLGNSWLLQQQPEKALPFLLEARAETSARSPFEVNTINVTLGRVYAALQDYDKAENMLQGALQTARHLDINRDMIRSHKTLSEVYAATGRYQRAYEHHLAYMALKDSVARADVLKNVNLMEVKYRSAIKDQEIIRQEAELKKKNIWIISIAGMTVLLLLLLLSFFANYRRRQKLQSERLRNLRQEQEIEKLKAVMEAEEKERGRIARELHDGIGGMLASIKMNLSVARDDYNGSLQNGKLNEVMKMVQDTATEVRKTSHNLMPDALIRNNLEKALMLYCDSINTGKQLQIDLECHGNLEQLDKSVELAVYRMCQELIQNIIKHANADQAVVQIMEHENTLSITVEDNGTGFDPEEHTGGFGLQNLRHRVHSLQGTISVMSAKERNTTVFIEFDLQKLKKKTAL